MLTATLEQAATRVSPEERAADEVQYRIDRAWLYIVEEPTLPRLYTWHAHGLVIWTDTPGAPRAGWTVQTAPSGQLECDCPDSTIGYAAWRLNRTCKHVALAWLLSPEREPLTEDERRIEAEIERQAERAREDELDEEPSWEPDDDDPEDELDYDPTPDYYDPAEDF